jgi:hypothetical protein
MEKLAYFVCSILWRGAAHQWRSGRHTIKTPTLGPYEEQFRKYLLGESAFPEHAAFWLSVISESMLWKSNLFPYGEKMDGRGFWRYKFIFQGLVFIFFTGKMIDPIIRHSCSYRSRLIFVSEKINEMILTDVGRLIVKSKVVGPLSKN